MTPVIVLFASLGGLLHKQKRGMDEHMETRFDPFCGSTAVHQVTVRSGGWKMSNSLSEFVPVVVHGETKV